MQLHHQIRLGRLQPILLALVIGGLLIPMGCARHNQGAPVSSPAQPTPTPGTPPSSPVDTSLIVKVVERVGDAVVRINASRVVGGRNSDPFLQPFGQPRRRTERGTGSGFIFDANGLVLTNAHVVENADQVAVVLKDGQQFQGRVMGADPLTDVAVVKIEAQNLPTIQLGNSETLKAGQWAIAIGNPLGLDNTVTVGIISATGRSSAQIGAPDQRVNFIQTDAAINPGNSGGPLLNLQGEVIGVNTAIIGDAQGLGFAIPIAIARRISQQLIQTGKATHAYLGVSMLELTPEVRDQINQRQPQLQIRRGQGVLIAEIVSNSPASSAGLQSGDVILSIEKTPIKTSEQVQQLVEAKVPGDRLTLEIERRNQKQTLQVTLGQLAPDTFTQE